eukprot:1161647-Pelagomonas_calceolata.AAC.3
MSQPGAMTELLQSSLSKGVQVLKCGVQVLKWMQLLRIRACNPAQYHDEPEQMVFGASQQPRADHAGTAACKADSMGDHCVSPAAN